MPIGKNSIKRVKNGGYSNVKSMAPDMENSTVIANPAPEVIEVMIPEAKPKAQKKPATRKKTVNSNENIQKNEEKTATERDGFCRFGLGEDLPSYLL